MDVTTKNAAGTSVKRKIFNATGYYADGKYYHYVKNYLGNVCAVVKSETDELVQSTIYYASGVPTPFSTDRGEQPYRGFDLENRRHTLSISRSNADSRLGYPDGFYSQ